MEKIIILGILFVFILFFSIIGFKNLDGIEKYKSNDIFIVKLRFLFIRKTSPEKEETEPHGHCFNKYKIGINSLIFQLINYIVVIGLLVLFIFNIIYSNNMLLKISLYIYLFYAILLSLFSTIMIIWFIMIKKIIQI